MLIITFILKRVFSQAIFTVELCEITMIKMSIIPKKILLISTNVLEIQISGKITVGNVRKKTCEKWTRSFLDLHCNPLPGVLTEGYYNRYTFRTALNV